MVLRAAFFARVCAAFFAAALRLFASRLRVAAAFFAAALRFSGPPLARSSSSSAKPRSSETTFFTPFGGLVRVIRDRRLSSSSCCLVFLAMENAYPPSRSTNISSSQGTKPHRASTRREPALPGRTTPCSGRSGTWSSSARSARVATPRPQNAFITP